MMSTTEEFLHPALNNNSSNITEGKGRGQIQIIFGPMFSGKTTELMRRMKRYELANKTCLVVKYARDVRYSNEKLATHDKQVFSAVAATELSGLLGKAMNYEVIGIDEGQFFHDVVSFSDRLAEQGKTVIVAALDGTFQKKGFGDILNLVPLAENVIKLTAVCMKCFSDASYTKRKGMETEVEVIGGAEKYLAVCRGCYFSPIKKAEEEEDKENTPILSDVTVQTKSIANRKLFLTPQRLNLS